MLTFNQFCFDPQCYKLTRGGEEVYLRQKLIQLLQYLLENNDRVVSKDELLQNVWQHGEYRERSLAQSILELRKALGDSASSPVYIRTVPQQGYQWICPVSEVPVAQAQESAELLGKAEKPDQSSVNQTGSKSPIKLVLCVAILISLLLLLFAVESSESENIPAVAMAESEGLNVLILPFDNETHSSSMQWVEYGLSDMLAGDLMLIPDLKVFAPAQSALLLSRSPQLIENSQRFANEALPLQTLLKQHGSDVLVLAQVRLVNQKQTLDYRIVSKQGEELTGSLSKNDLAVAMPDIARHIYQQLRPHHSNVRLPEYGYKPNAMHDYARGIQALQLSGPSLAQHYFAASVQIDGSHHWSQAYRALCLILLGNWRQAEQLLLQIDTDTDPALEQFRQLWLAQLWLRTGQLVKATQFLTNNDVKELSGLKLQQFIDRQKGILSNQIVSQESSSEVSALWHVTNLLMELDDFKGIDDTADVLADTSLRQLAVQGHKPVLMRALLLAGSNPEMDVERRQAYLERALALAQVLGQPYEQALIHILRAQLMIGLPARGADADGLIADDLNRAELLATDLRASLLIAEIKALRARI